MHLETRTVTSNSVSSNSGSTASPLYLQFSSVTQLCLTICDPWIAARQASQSIINSWSSLRLTSIESVMSSSHLTLCHPLLLPPLNFPNIRVFPNESVLHKWPNYWSFSFRISLSNEYSGLISLWWTGWNSLLYERLSRVFSSTTVQKHQFFGAQLSL